MTRLLGLLTLALLPGCATILNGTHQAVAIETLPAGASCSVDQGGSNVGTIASTPGVLPISKSRQDLTITCNKEGFETATARSASTFNALTFINFALGGAIGFLVDAASGANFDYQFSVSVPLVTAAAPVRTSSVRPQYEPPAMRPTSVETRTLLASRMMELPDGAKAKRDFLAGACSAGDQTACILIR